MAGWISTARRGWRARSRRAVRVALIVWAPIGVVLAIILAVSAATEVSIFQLMQDPATVLEGSFYIGLGSSVGNVLWAAALAACLLPLLYDRRLGGEARRFLLAGAALTVVLLTDDLFLLHDEILPIHLGIPGEVFGVVYLVAVPLFLYRFRATIAATDYPLLGIALLCFAASVAIDIDVVEPLGLPSRIELFLEDGFKLLGIGSWLAYFALAGAELTATKRAEATDDSGDPR